jgi:hypothetical protein
MSTLGKRGERENSDGKGQDVAGEGHEQPKKLCGAGKKRVGAGGKEEELEATGHGAPGKLVGAKDGACQQP